MQAEPGTSGRATRTRIHLDTDFAGDIDDLCALALLLSHRDVELSGITTVLELGGQRAGFARYVLALADRAEVPVAAGADVSLGRFRDSEYGLPSGERYWPEPVAAAPGDLEAALALLERSIEAGATVVAIGPLTNLALLEERHPGILARARLVLMGGSIDPAPPGFPQWTFEMDFNLQTDAAAAARVLEGANPAQTTLVPIEVSSRTALRASDLPALSGGGAFAALIGRQAEAFAVDEGYRERYGRSCAGLPDDLVNFQHDPLACAVALGWPGATIETVPLAVGVEGGWLRLTRDPRGRAFRVATAVDGAAFGVYWLDALLRGEAS